MVSIERPEFVPDPSLEHDAMAALQRELAADARWTDDLGFDPAAVSGRAPFRDDPASTQTDLDEATSGGSGATLEVGASEEDDGDATLSVEASDEDGDDATLSVEASEEDEGDAAASGDEPDVRPVVAGVDQAFTDDAAVSAVVATRGGEVIERATATAPLEIPYIPGLLSFREGGAILAALEALDVEPDVLLCDGSGRIHYRQAGLATHVGVTCDVPTVGVAKALLCGEPTGDIDGLSTSEVVPIAASDGVESVERSELTPETVVGAAVQSRQFESGDRSINPLYVSPGHRVGWETAAKFALATTAGYKLPEPIRIADREVGELAAER